MAETKEDFWNGSGLALDLDETKISKNEIQV